MVEVDAWVVDALKELERHFHPVDPFAGLDTIPDEPDVKPVNRRLIPVEACTLLPRPDPQPVDVVRKQILSTLHDYANNKKTFRLLVGAPAGIGKSHQGIQFVQERAALGERWLWAAQNHAMFEDLSGHSNFDASLWYHWQPMDGEINGDPACRYPGAQRAWTDRGYKSWNLCRQLCGRKNYKDPSEIPYMETCPFRTQGIRRWPIVFAMHQHLFTGIDAGKFDGIVIDESFISLIAREKYIPGDQLKQGEINLAVIRLANKLIEVWGEIRSGTRPGYVAGKALLDAVGDIYPDAALQLQELDEAPELRGAAKHYRNPPVWEPGQVQSLQTIYMDDLVAALYPEYTAWSRGKEYWAERVWMDKDGLHYVTPAQLWPDLPRKVIVLDATGRAGFYQYALGGQVEEYRPGVERVGKIYQVAGRQNGKSVAIERTPAKDPKTKSQKYDTELSQYAQEFVRVARELTVMRGYKNIAVITFQQAEKMIAEAMNLPPERVMHFYKLRGRNDLQEVDAMFIYGTPSPQERTVTNIMLALEPGRIDPIYEIDDRGRHRPLYVPRQHEFRLSDTGLQTWQAARGQQYHGAARMVGSYRDPMAAAIQAQLREAELLQAIYRARLITNPADVWVFSSIPTDEPLDGLFDDPPIAPGRVSWKLWLKIHTWCKDRAETGEAFGYTELAEGIGSREDYLRSVKALDAITEFYGGQVERVRLTNANLKKGRVREMIKIGNPTELSDNIYV